MFNQREAGMHNQQEADVNQRLHAKVQITIEKAEKIILEGTASQELINAIEAALNSNGLEEDPRCLQTLRALVDQASKRVI
jgi:hypothetical protein